ncbi:hypothetical protein KM043_012038 [Ampulex compressa]|nr:hypothetical protein KM043_012038 [Ampulex compressa]
MNYLGINSHKLSLFRALSSPPFYIVRKKTDGCLREAAMGNSIKKLFVKWTWRKVFCSGKRDSAFMPMDALEYNYYQLFPEQHPPVNTLGMACEGRIKQLLE